MRLTQIRPFDHLASEIIITTVSLSQWQNLVE